mgnify:CR=1 FL=1|jgi:hypothetical protein
MLAYSKLILEKVSFSKELFEREYKKALRNLSDSEALHLKEWISGEGKKLIPISATV